MSYKSAGAVTDSSSHIGTDTFNVAVPANTDGDVLFLFGYRGNDDGDFSVPAGWTRISAIEESRSSSDSFRTFVAYRVASSEPASYDLTHTDTVARTQSAVIVAYENIDAAIFDATPDASHGIQESNNNTPTPPSITTATNNAIVLAIQWVSNAEITSAAAPTGYDLRVNHTPFNDRNIVVSDKVVTTAGVETPSAWQHTTSDQFGDGATAVIALRPVEVNIEPVVDTPISDISIPGNTSGTIADISGNFSDGNGDTLTYSVNPALPAGMTLNTTTGIISGSGSITETAATNYTFTANDGNGGSVNDVVNIEITAPTPAVTAITPCRLGEPFTVTVEHFDLTTADTLELRIDGTAITGPASYTATTATFNMPAGGFQTKSGAVFVLRITAGAVDIDIPIGPALSQVPTGDQAYTFGKPLVAPNGDWLLIGTAGSAHVAADNRIVLLRSPVGPNQGLNWTDPVTIFKDENPADTFDTSTRQFACYVDPLTNDIIVQCGVIKTNFNPFTEGYFRVHTLRSSDNGDSFSQTDITSQIPDAVTGNGKLLFHGDAVETIHGTAICLYSADEVRIAYTTDGSYTWSNIVTVNDAPSDGPYGTATEPALVAVTPSNLVLSCRHNEQAGTKAYMKSTNGGHAFGNRSAYTTVGELGCTVDQPIALKLVGDHVYFAFPCRLPTGKLITNRMHKDDFWADPAQIWHPSSPNRQTPYTSNTLDSQNAEGNSQAYIDFGNAYIAEIPGTDGEALIAFFDHAPYPENPVHTVQLNVGTFPDQVS